MLVSHRNFSTSFHHAKIKMSLEDNHYKVSLPLPTSGDCIFFLRGDQTVKNFLDDIKAEDSTVQSVAVGLGSAKVSQSTSLERVLKSPFSVEINEVQYEVVPPAREIIPSTEVVPNILHEEEHPLVIHLRREIAPLLAQKLKLDAKSNRYANLIMYGGLGFLVAQWCFLARLTWWEFNWDIMEPVTYFITFGTAVIGYAYFALQKRDYSFVDLRESILVNKMFKEYSKNNFDVDKYYALEYKLNQIDPTALDAMRHVLADADLNQQEKVEAASKIVEESLGSHATRKDLKEVRDIVEGKP